MKHIRLIYLMLLVVVASCDPSEYRDVLLILQGGNELRIGWEGGDFFVNVISSDSYEVWVDKSASSWIAINGSPVNAANFIIGKNSGGQSRTGKLFFTLPGAVTQVFTVYQDSSDERCYLHLPQTSYRIGLNGGIIDVEVDAYLEPNVEILDDGAEWIALMETDSGKYSFEVAKMNDMNPRTGRIIFSSTNCENVEVVVTQAGEIERKSLVLKYTGDWCGYCPFMSFMIRNAQTKCPDSMVPISVYYSSASMLSSDASNQLVELNKITSYPIGIMDYRARISNSSIFGDSGRFPDIYRESADLYAAVAGFGMSAGNTDGIADLKLEIMSIEDDSDALLCVYVIEDGIVSYQSFYGNPAQYPDVDFSTYLHDHVLKDALTPVAGEKIHLSVGKAVRSYSYKPRDGMDMDNLGFVAFILRRMPETSVQAVPGVSYLNGEYYVDNVECVKIGEIKTVKYK